MKKIFLVLLLSLTAALAFGQRHKMGVIMDDSAYHSPNFQTPPGDIWGTSYVPRHVSLRPFTPDPQDQGDCESCVGWASAYACITTRWAIDNNVTDKKLINANAYDAMYLYTRIGVDCKPINILNGINVISSNGIALSKDVAKPVTSATTVPADKLQKAYYTNRLFDLDADSLSRVTSTISSLATFMPVMIVAKIDTTLFNITPEYKVWVPSAKLPTSFHAMCVIGFDDKTQLFEVMNSWGSTWGDHGYFFISYKDYARAVNYAFNISMSDVATISINDLNGAISIFSAKAKQPFTEIEPKQGFSGDYVVNYRASKFISRGDTYQLRLTNLRQSRYAYIIGVETTKASLLYPAINNKAAVVAKLGRNGASVTPLNSKGGATALPGLFRYLVIYAQKPVDINAVVLAINKNIKANPALTVYDVLVDRLIPPSSINYQSGLVSVGNVRLNHDIMVMPITIEIN